MENAHKVWLAGLGAFAAAEEEGAKFLKNLMEKGEEIESKGKEHLEKAKGAASGVKTVAESYWDTFGQTLDETMTTVIHRMGVPTKDEIRALNKKVSDLSKAVEKLRTKEAKPAAKAATRKPAARKPAARKPAAKAAAKK
ncbi:MAG: phasin family protein [Thermoanaerobaculales bacterium]|nr:phasin family protein [Thermoanaerobaculales bacterium]